MTKENFWDKGNRLCDRINNETNWIIILGIVIGAIIEDVFHRLYVLKENVLKLDCCIFENIYESESIRCLRVIYSHITSDDYTLMGILVAIMVVLWTFTVSLCINCLDKVDSRYYGVSVGACLERYGIEKLILIGGIEFGQMVLMVFAVIFRWNFTLLAICFVQLYTIPAIFCIIMFKTSRAKILEYVYQEGEAVISGRRALNAAPMLSSMLRNMDYQKNQDLEKLEAILISFSNKSECRYKCIVEIIDMIIRNVSDEELLWNLVKKWFRDASKLEVKLGIVLSILENFENDGLRYVTSLVEMSEKETFEELCIWIIVHELYQSRYVGEQWRVHNARYVNTYYLRLDTDEKKGMALKYWEEISGSRDEIYIVHEFIGVN